MPPDLSRRCAIAVMAKAPRTGRVKTRLCPPLAPDEAMEMSAAFLRDITENIDAAAVHAPIDPFVAFAPAGLEHLFDGMLAGGTGLILADGETAEAPEVQGFGRCLLHAASGLLAQGYGAVCLLNADSPTLPTSLLVQAAQALLAPGPRCVLGPADDGGYYLIGQQGLHPHLYMEIAWSTDIVADQTRARASALGLAMTELAPWYDVDDEPALRRLLLDLSFSPPAPAREGRSEEWRQHCPAVLHPNPAPATAACVASLGLAARFAATA